jgi:uncharacterized Zn finger protein
VPRNEAGEVPRKPMQNIKLREKSIREHTGEQSLELARDYAQRRAIFDTKQQGSVLKARCEGSRPEPYRLWARLDPKGSVVESSCSCPIGGRCKHVAALLLCWRSQPDEFLRLVPISDFLASQSKEELQELIAKMLQRAPELEDLLEVPLIESEAHQYQSELEATRRQISAFFRRFVHRPNLEVIAQGLQAFVTNAQEHLQKEQWQAAATILVPLVTEIVTQHEEELDEAASLLELVASCVTMLGKILEKISEAELRGTILRALFEVYRFDIEAGGITVGDEIPGIFLRTLGAEERAWVASQVRDSLETARDWGRQELGGLLLNLEGERLDNEAFLQLCRETHRWYELANRLLFLGQLEGILAVGLEASEADALRIADLLVTQKQGPLAEKMIAEKEQKKANEKLSAWLASYRAALGDPAAALSAAIERLETKPSLIAYQEVRRLSQLANSWDQLSVRLHKELQEKDPDLLRQIFLEEGRIEEAIALLPPMKSSDFIECYPHLLTAEAAEKTLPNAALDIYRSYVALQDQNSVSACKEACRVLLKMKKLYLANHQAERWQEELLKIRRSWKNAELLELEAKEAGLIE